MRSLGLWPLWQVRDWDFFYAIEGFCACRNVVDGVKYLGAVVTHSASVADAYSDSLKYDETLFVLERFAVDFPGTNRPVTVLT